MAALISKRIIKPCSATPESLRIYHLSSIDQACSSFYVPIAFFYPSVCGRFGSRFQISKHIEDSLSKSLVYYYPFAGRIVGNHHISCNDAGVELREVQSNRQMSEILSNTDSFAEDVVFPSGLPWNEIENDGDSLVVIQLNYFDCGGLAIAACVSHKIGDASTLISFMNDWATICREPNYIPSPEFVANTVFPPLDIPMSSGFPPSAGTGVVARRFVFRPAELEKLKAIAAESGIEKPTRVEVVNAFLIQRALAAYSTADSGSLRPLLLIQPTNLRPCIQLRHNSIGTIASINNIVVEDTRVSFPELVSHLRTGKVKFQNVFKQKVFPKSPLQDSVREIEELASRGRYHTFLSSSLCGYPLHEVEFGWEKPTRVCLSQIRVKGVLYLMDTPDNGVEAMFGLDEQQMSTLEHDKELLSFTSFRKSCCG